MTSFPTRACASLSLPKTESSDAYLTDVDGNVSELEGPIHPPLGSGDDKPAFTPTRRQLGSGERLILVTDGVTHRRTESGNNGIYIGGGRLIHSPHSGDVVRISSIHDSWYASNWVGARRV